VQQVMQLCVDNIFQNGLLPLKPAQGECYQCVTNALGQLGFKQPAGVGVNAWYARVRLNSTQNSELNNACNQSDVDD
jgi:hypothetical protein